MPGVGLGMMPNIFERFNLNGDTGVGADVKLTISPACPVAGFADINSGIAISKDAIVWKEVLGPIFGDLSLKIGRQIIFAEGSV